MDPLGQHKRRVGPSRFEAGTPRSRNCANCLGWIAIPRSRLAALALPQDDALGLAPVGISAVWDFALFGISRSSGFRAVRDFAPFGISRRSGFRALCTPIAHRPSPALA